MAVIDTLKLARALRDKGGFTQDAAEATAEALDDAFGEAAATKRDITDLGTSLGTEITDLRTSLRTDLAALGTSLRTDIVALEHRVDQLAADLRKEIADKGIELLKWVIGIVGFQTVAILGGVAALIHLLK